MVSRKNCADISIYIWSSKLGKWRRLLGGEECHVTRHSKFVCILLNVDMKRESPYQWLNYCHFSGKSDKKKFGLAPQWLRLGHPWRKVIGAVMKKGTSSRVSDFGTAKELTPAMTWCIQT